MNIYADRGNLLFLQRRCEWRGLGFKLSGADPGEAIDPDAHDLFYIGGGQDRDQALCAQDLATVKRDALHEAAAAGAVVFARLRRLPAARPLLRAGRARRCPGLGLVDLHTVRSDGAAADRQRRHRGRPRRRRRACSPASRTTAAAPTSAPASTPLGRVLAGHGNNGADGHEGVLRGNVVGTYLHGPLLPKNAWFADWLIATALGLESLDPLDDTLEDAAHAAARRAAGA